MKMKVLIFAALMVGGIARATEVRLNQPTPEIDLNIIQTASQDLLPFVDPDPTPEPTPGPSPDPSPGPKPEPSPEPSPAPSPDPSPAPSPTPAPQPDKRWPQACKDANITEDQKTQIKDAIYKNMRDEVQLKANLKLAFMHYGHTVMDKNSAKTDGETSGNGIVDAITKLAQGHLALSNNILYDIVTPDQRAKTYECMMELHKKKHKRGGKHGRH